MSEISYFLATFADVPCLCKREGRRFKSLALKTPEGWVRTPKGLPAGSIEKDGPPEITKEEAAMILFECREPA